MHFRVGSKCKIMTIWPTNASESLGISSKVLWRLMVLPIVSDRQDAAAGVMVPALPSAATRMGVVIPCRDDAPLLEKCLASLSDFSADQCIVVVNADKSSATSAIAANAGVRCVPSDTPDRGRAAAAGVLHLLSDAALPPDVILIAHADMEFRPHSRTVLIAALGTNARWRWGAMGHRITSARLKFRFVEIGNRLRANWFCMPYGDQAMFFGVDILTAAGGFPRQDCLEDYELSLRLKRAAYPIYVNYPVRISDRHWRRGVMRTSVRNWHTALRYRIMQSDDHKSLRHANTAYGPVVI